MTRVAKANHFLLYYIENQILVTAQVAVSAVPGCSDSPRRHEDAPARAGRRAALGLTIVLDVACLCHHPARQRAAPDRRWV